VKEEELTVELSPSMMREGERGCKRPTFGDNPFNQNEQPFASL